MQHRTRREVLATMGCAIGGAAFNSLAPTLAEAVTATPGRKIKFGVQLNAFAIDPKNFDTFTTALSQVKDLGYQGFEAGYRNLAPQFDSPADARHRIDQTGLTFFGIHIFMPPTQYDPKTFIAPNSLYEPVARGGVSLGARHIIFSAIEPHNEQELQQKIDGLNAAGRFANSVGIKAAYHNEFESKTTATELEALYKRTDPTLVSFVLDAGHAYRCGIDVPAFIREHHKRIVGFHFRDYTADGKLVSLGGGTFPLKQVADTIKQIGWSGWVENEEEREDHSHTGLQVIAPAYNAMKEAFGA
jgi:inosose dehydratase